MGNRILTALVGVGSALAIAPRVAKASLPPTACSTASLQVCAAVSASTASVSGRWHLYLKVWNLYGTHGLSHVITYVGMGSGGYTGTGTLVGAKFNGNAITTWQTAKTIPSNGVGAELDLASQTKSGITNGLIGCSQQPPPGHYQTCYPNGAFLELDFLTSAQFDLNDPSAVYGWHSQAVSGRSCSLWVSSDGTQTQPSEGDGSDCGVVPEPVTMLLLGSGLAGMGGIGALRRRKKDGDVESA